MILGALFRAFDDPHELPRIMTDTEIMFGTENALIDYTNKLRALTTQDIVATANKYFQEENYSTAILTPKKTAS